MSTLLLPSKAGQQREYSFTALDVDVRREVIFDVNAYQGADTTIDFFVTVVGRGGQGRRYEELINRTVIADGQAGGGGAGAAQARITLPRGYQISVSANADGLCRIRASSSSPWITVLRGSVGGNATNNTSPTGRGRGGSAFAISQSQLPAGVSINEVRTFSGADGDDRSTRVGSGQNVVTNTGGLLPGGFGGGISYSGGASARGNGSRRQQLSYIQTGGHGGGWFHAALSNHPFDPGRAYLGSAFAYGTPGNAGFNIQFESTSRSLITGSYNGTRFTTGDVPDLD